LSDGSLKPPWVVLGQLAARFRCGRESWVLPGTQNDHDSVTFGEDEQPVVGVHADAMVFAVTA
jgi:hypothetical protein